MKGKFFSLALAFASFVFTVAVAANGVASIAGAYQPQEPQM